MGFAFAKKTYIISHSIKVELERKLRRADMAKEKNAFVCSECGYQSTKWLGQCPSCRAWNTLEEKVLLTPVNSLAGMSLGAQAVLLKDVSM